MMVKTTSIPHVFYPIQGKAPMATETEKKLIINFTDGSELVIKVENVSIIKYTEDGMLKSEITRNADNPENNGYDEDYDWESDGDYEDDEGEGWDPDGDYEDDEERAIGVHEWVEMMKERYND